MQDESYKTYFESMPCFLSIQDRDLKIIDANERFVKSFGNHKGRYCYQVYKQRPDKCEDCPVEKTFRDGQPYTSEQQVKTLGGRDLSVLVNTTPIRDANGDITAVMEMSTDITDIKILQKQLTESQARYRQLFEEVPCYISIQDKDLRIVDCNRLWREAFGTAYGSKCYKIYKHREKECLPCTVRQTFDDGQAKNHEEVVTRLDGKRINVLVHTAPICNTEGEIDKVIEMSFDITEIRQLQDKLSSVGLLIGSISHGIKGLLNGLDGGIYLINSGLKKDDNERVNKGWDIAQRNIRRIRSMVMDILYYAKDREPYIEEIDATEFTTEICNMMSDRAEKLKIELNPEIDADAGIFEVDHQQIRSMMVNLIENSIDACRIDKEKSDHKVTVKVDSKTNSVVFEVSDDGIGMDQETREKAFSLFFSSKGAGGTGLGLFIANKIAKSHGGRIKVESEVGQGCRFIVEIPRKYVKLEVVDEDGDEGQELENNS